MFHVSLYVKMKIKIGKLRMSTIWNKSLIKTLIETPLDFSFNFERK